MAYQGHIVIPTSHPDSSETITTVAKSMAVRFGGYSRYEGSGGWGNGGGIQMEDHVRLVVDFDPENDHFDKERFVEWLKIEAEYVKSTLIEDAVLVEVHEMDMVMV